MAMSDSSSDSFGKHLTHKEIINFFSPVDDTVNAVKEWLIASGITKERISQSFNNLWIEFNATVSEAEGLLQTQYHHYVHSSGRAHVACQDYAVPHHIQEHVDLIMPTLHFDVLAKAPIGKKTKRDSVGTKFSADVTKRATGDGMRWTGPKKGKEPITGLELAKSTCSSTSKCLKATAYDTQMLI